jgi:hypothetical protein
MAMISSMHTYKMGDKITDPSGNKWVICAIWHHNNWLCFGLLGEQDKDIMGGYRIKLYEVIWS